MLRILKEILTTYDESVGERLSPQDGIMWPNKMRMALEAISAKPIPRVGFCHAHCIRKFGYRKHPRIIKTAFGKLEQPISPNAVPAERVMPYNRKESKFEHEVIEAVIDTNYRRLIEGRSIDISLGGIHNVVVDNDVDNPEKMPVDLDGLSAIMADGTGYERQKGQIGELPSVIGITNRPKRRGLRLSPY